MSAFDGQADLLATLIASSATFQSATSTASVALAKAKIGLPEAYDDSNDGETAISYPRAIISDGGPIERERIGTSTWKGTGSLFLAFEFTVNSGTYTTEKTQRAWFLTQVSTIMREAEVISDSRATPSGYSTSHLNIRKYRKTAGPLVVMPSEREHANTTELSPLWAMEFEVEY